MSNAMWLAVSVLSFSVTVWAAILNKGSRLMSTEHEPTDDEAPPQWEQQPAREEGHPH